jgi:hypothetical protein
LMMRSLNHWRKFRIPWCKFTETRIIASAADHKTCYNWGKWKAWSWWMTWISASSYDDYKEIEIQQPARYDCVWTRWHDYYAYWKWAEVKDSAVWDAYWEVYTVLLCNQKKNRKINCEFVDVQHKVIILI